MHAVWRRQTLWRQQQNSQLLYSFSAGMHLMVNVFACTRNGPSSFIRFIIGTSSCWTSLMVALKHMCYRWKRRKSLLTFRTRYCPRFSAFTCLPWFMLRLSIHEPYWVLFKRFSTEFWLSPTLPSLSHFEFSIRIFGSNIITHFSIDFI